MAIEVKKDNSLIAFRNIKLKEGDPDYKGEMLVDGERKSISIWIKEDKNNEQFITGAVNPPSGKRINTY